MKSTKFNSDDARKMPEVALPYRKNWKTEDVAEIPFARWGDVGPAGSINSSIDDMAKYLAMHINKGMSGGKQILGKNNAEQMQSPQMVMQGTPPFPEKSEGSYGMGLFIETYRGYKHAYHGSNLDGFSLQLSFLPNDGIGVVVLTNLSGTSLRDLVPYYIYDQLLGAERVDWVERFRAIERKGRAQQLDAEKKGFTGRKAGTRPAHELVVYSGEFEHPGYGTLAVRVDTSSGAPKLVMKLNDVERPLEHFHFDSFQVPENPLDSFEQFRITFQTSDQGEVASLLAVVEPSVKAIEFTRRAEKRMFETSFLRQFAGDYDAPGAVLTVSLAGESKLQMSTPGAPPRMLIPKTGTRFDVQGRTGLTLEFKQGPGGEVTELVVFSSGSAQVMPRKR